MMLAPEKAKEIRESEDGKERFWSIISQVCKHDSRKVSILFTTKLYFYKKKKCGNGIMTKIQVGGLYAHETYNLK